ncbi:MAG: carboxylating nicotinate-nucleotide diphosphorylase [Oscillospiraceae bacterium]|nr:carboxylating nicotinate-nucleotide diphosphorylase [Oscillospiraceae bacterium]
MILNQFYIDNIIKTALDEDINYVDVTSDYLIPEEQRGVAVFRSKAEGVLCGLEAALRVFELLDKEFKAECFFKDGARLKKGDIICRLEGRTRNLLKAERTALNLIQHMSGIATATARLAALCEGTKAVIADTRKTLPGLRPLQKYSVTVGGGQNHRYNLSSAAMLKDNHIDAGGGITAALAKLRGRVGHMVKIEVETRNLDEVREAIEAGADIIMLDNMDVPTMTEAVKLGKGKAVFEASGGINEQSVKAIAQTGVDIISTGVITHSVVAFDISMVVES